MLNLFRQQNEGRKVPTAIREYIEQQQQHCRPCQAHAELPRVPKLAIPLPATPNIAVSLDVMPHRVRTHTAQILVILDHGDMMLRLHKLEASFAVAAFNTYLSRWISIFDSPSFTIVDRGSNLANQYMRDNLRTLDSQLCPIPTEAPWSLGRNERSHRFLHKAIDRLLSDTSFEPGHILIHLLAEVEIAWNCTQHTNRVLPHLHRFGVMPRVLGELENSPSTQERIALMQLLRTETDKLRAEEVLKSDMHSYRRHMQSLRQFSIGQKVWFHRRNFGWRQGSIARLERPNIFLSYKDKLYPTHESRLRPFFGELSLPPEIRANDNKDSVVMDRPAQIAAAGESTTVHNPAPLSQILDPVFCVRNASPSTQPDYIISANENLMVSLSASPTGIIDSSHVHYLAKTQVTDQDAFHTAVEMVKKLSQLPAIQQQAFDSAKQEEIKFLLNAAVTPVPQQDMDNQCELQPLKWVLFIKRSTKSDTPTRFRVRLVSASHLSVLRHALNGNAPTIAASSIRIMLSLAPTWDQALRRNKDRLILLVRDVTKAYLQSKPTKRLVYNKPPPEFFQQYPEKHGQIWKANVQLYGDVEAGE